MTGFIVLGSIATYLAIAACVYRHLYKKTYAEYLRWKNADPEKFVAVSGRSSKFPRKDVEWYLYKEYSNVTRPETVAAFWLPLLVIIPMAKFLHPEVRVPDMPKISELEKL